MATLNQIEYLSLIINQTIENPADVKDLDNMGFDIQQYLPPILEKVDKKRKYDLNNDVDSPVIQDKILKINDLDKNARYNLLKKLEKKLIHSEYLEAIDIYQELPYDDKGIIYYLIEDKKKAATFRRF